MVLKNKKHDRFAKNIAKGMPKTEAYKVVYECKDMTASNQSTALLKRPEIQDRVNEIIEKIPGASLDSVIKSVSKKLKAKKEVIYNSKGDSKLINDNQAQLNAEEKLLKIHGVKGFGHTSNTFNDNRVQAINLKPEDITALAQLVKEMKTINSDLDLSESLQSGEVIDVTPTVSTD